MTPCKVWHGDHRAHDGRPVIGKRYAYRVLWERRYGRLAPGLVLHHTCEHEWCVNLDHLAPMTQAQHAAEHQAASMASNRARTDAQTHCVNGHEYTPENTLHVRRMRAGLLKHERRCRICAADAKRRYRRRM